MPRSAKESVHCVLDFGYLGSIGKKLSMRPFLRRLQFLQEEFALMLRMLKGEIVYVGIQRIIYNL